MRDTPFELTFEIDRAISGRPLARLEKALNAVQLVRGRTVLLSIEAHGSDCVSAAHDSIDVLRSAGVQPLRLVEDLVTRSEIARRSGVTPQAVGLWGRGERHADRVWPEPYHLLGTELWLWSEVLDVLPGLGIELDDLPGPSRLEIQIIGNALANSVVSAAV